MKGKNWTWPRIGSALKIATFDLPFIKDSVKCWLEWNKMYRVGPLMNNHTMQCIATELSEVEIKEKRTHNDLINARTLAALQEYQDTPENIPVQQQFSRIKCFGHGKAPSRCKIYELCLSRKRYKRRLLSACQNSNFA